MSHLNDSTTYVNIENSMDKCIHEKIKSLVTEYEPCFKSDEAKYLVEHDYRSSSFYILPKIHKSKIIGNACKNLNEMFTNISEFPNDLKSRPIINNVNSPTSHLSHFIDSILKPLISKIPGYIKDSFDFLSKIPIDLTGVSFLSLDVVSLYTVIPHDLGLEAIEYWCRKFPGEVLNQFPLQFILDSLTIILKHNTFVYANKYYKQITGTAMGTKVAPTYAHLVMGYLEKSARHECEKQFGTSATNEIYKYYYRFLDDIFIFWPHSVDLADEFTHIMNNVNPNFKFTHEISNKQLHFLDVTLINENGNLKTDLYSKPTDAHQYLHFHSYHPAHTKRNLPYNLANRIKRIVNSEPLQQLRFSELRENLLSLKYPASLIDNAIESATNSVICNRNSPSPSVNTNMVFTYSNKNVKMFNERIRPHVNSLNLSSFNDNQIVLRKCLRQPRNLLRTLNSGQFCVTKCGKARCKTCSIIIQRRHSHIINERIVYFNANMNCCSKNVIYVLFCKNCEEYYVGETNMTLNLRVNLHRQHINNPQYSFLHVSSHIRSCGSEFQILPIYKVSNNSTYIIRRLEEYFIYFLSPTLNRC